jgi:hypothetical protein
MDFGASLPEPNAGTTFVPRAREDTMARAGRERCSLKITRRPDPVSPDEVGKERTEGTAGVLNLTTPAELVVLSSGRGPHAMIGLAQSSIGRTAATSKLPRKF